MGRHLVDLAVDANPVVFGHLFEAEGFPPVPATSHVRMLDENFSAGHGEAIAILTYSGASGKGVGELPAQGGKRGGVDVLIALPGSVNWFGSYRSASLLDRENRTDRDGYGQQGQPVPQRTRFHLSTSRWWILRKRGGGTDGPLPRFILPLYWGCSY